MRSRLTTVSRPAILAFTALLACSGGGESAGPDPNGGNIAIAIGQAILNALVGGTATTTATVTRTGNFTGSVSVTATGMPNGVTLTGNTQSTVGAVTTATLTFTIAGTATTGSSTVTVTASGSGVTSTSTTFTLTLTTAANGSIAIQLSPNAGTAAQGTNTTTTVALTRTNFTGSVTMSAEGLPQGVTAAFNPQPITSLTSLLTLTVGASVPAQVYQVTIRASTGGTTADATASFALTVTATATGGFTLSATPAALSIAQGAGGTATINVARTAPFIGAVALTVEGAPNGLTTGFTPASTTGTTSTLTLTAAANATAGVHTLTIRGTATGATQQVTTIQLTITTSGGGNGTVTLDFSACSALNKPIWVAGLDGEGTTWFRVIGTNDTYTFTINQAKGGYTYVTAAANGARTTTIFLGTRTEASSFGAVQRFCNVVAPPTRTITGMVTGVGAGEGVNVNLGNRFGNASLAFPNFTLTNVPDGTHDLVAFRGGIAPGATDRGLIRQDQALAHNTNVGTLDMNGAESFAAATGSITIPGVAPGAIITGSSVYLSGATCNAAILTGGSFAASPFLMVGIPDARMRATDMHQFTTTVFEAGVISATRVVTQVFHSMVDRTIPLPPDIIPIVIQNPVNAYKKLNAVTGLPAEYNLFVNLNYAPNAGTRHTVNMTGTAGWIGSTGTVGLVTPTFTGISGWDDTWAPPANAAVTWNLTASGSTHPMTSTQCVDGIRQVTTARSGQLP